MYFRLPQTRLPTMLWIIESHNTEREKTEDTKLRHQIRHKVHLYRQAICISYGQEETHIQAYCRHPASNMTPQMFDWIVTKV